MLTSERTQVYEKEENVFVAGSWVSYLHITATGTYDYIEGTGTESRERGFPKPQTTLHLACFDWKGGLNSLLLLQSNPLNAIQPPFPPNLLGPLEVPTTNSGNRCKGRNRLTDAATGFDQEGECHEFSGVRPEFAVGS